MARAEYQLTLPARTETDDDPAVAAVLGKAKAQTGESRTCTPGMANVPGLLETYLAGYGAFRQGSGFGPTEQEVVLLAISRANGCTYCVTAHSAIADGAKVPTAVTDALRASDPLPDPRLDALATFTMTMVDTRGHADDRDRSAALQRRAAPTQRAHRTDRSSVLDRAFGGGSGWPDCRAFRDTVRSRCSPTRDRRIGCGGPSRARLQMGCDGYA